MASLLGIGNLGLAEKYLGSPIFFGKSKIGAFQGLVDRIKLKVEGWKAQLLSQAGKTTLIKAVVSAMPIYQMSSFLLPKKTCSDIDSLTNNFWWGTKEDGSNRMHYRKWEEICRPKSQGGLGFRMSHLNNVAMLSKLCWKLETEPNNFWCKIMKAKYFHNTSFLESKVRAADSYMWKGLHKTKELLKNCFVWRVGDGSKIKLWENQWILENSNRKVNCPRNFSQGRYLVKHLLNLDGLSWNNQVINSLFPMDLAAKIIRIPLSSQPTEDSIRWVPAKMNVHNVKDTYKFLQDLEPVILNSYSRWSSIWNLQVAYRVQIVLWKMLWNMLPTKANLVRRRANINDRCLWCHQADECIDHLMLRCPFSQMVWNNVFPAINLTSLFAGSLRDWFEFWVADSRFSVMERARNSAKVACVLWSLWMARNQTLHNNIPPDLNLVMVKALGVLKDSGVRRSIISKWEKPKLGFMKLNSDGAWDERNNNGAASWIIRDSDGMFVFAGVKAGSYGSSKEAEAEGLREGLLWARRLGIERICCECDAKEIADESMTRRSSGSLKTVAILEDIWKIADFFVEFTLNFNFREANIPAHVIAAWGKISLTSSNWGVCPQWLESYLQKDRG